ncbi:TPA: hypothetical protein ACGG8E_001135, partial [Vibrio cholerae]
VDINFLFIDTSMTLFIFGQFFAYLARISPIQAIYCPVMRLISKNDLQKYGTLIALTHFTNR